MSLLGEINKAQKQRLTRFLCTSETHVSDVTSIYRTFWPKTTHKNNGLTERTHSSPIAVSSLSHLGHQGPNKQSTVSNLEMGRRMSKKEDRERRVALKKEKDRIESHSPAWRSLPLEELSKKQVNKLKKFEEREALLEEIFKDEEQKKRYFTGLARFTVDGAIKYAMNGARR